MDYRGEDFERGGGELLLVLIPLALLVTIAIVAYGWFRYREGISIGAFFSLWGELIKGGVLISVIVATALLLAGLLLFAVTAAIVLAVALWTGAPFGHVMKEGGSSLFLALLIATGCGGLWYWARDK